MREIKEKEDILSFFIYEADDGAIAYKKFYFKDGDVRYQTRDKRRHYVNKTPDKFFPYNNKTLIQSDPERLVYIVGDEFDVDLFSSLDMLATCGMDGLKGDTWTEEWNKYFAGRHVIAIQSCSPRSSSVAMKAFQILALVAKSVHLVELPGMEEGESILKCWERTELDKGKLAELISERIEQIHKVKRADVDKAPPPPVAGIVTVSPADVEEEIEYSNSNWKPFPLEVFHPKIAAFVEAAAASLPTDPAYVALPVLTSLGASIGTSRVCCLKDGWTEPAIVWGVLVADSSTLKSPAMDKGVLPFDQIQDELDTLYASEAKTYRYDEQEYQVNFDKSKREGNPDFTLDPPEKPARRAFLVEDITIEAIYRLHSENQKGLFVVRDELAGWCGSFSRYRSGKGAGSDLQFWLEAFRGKWKRIDRKTGDLQNVVLKQTAISILGTIQPKIMRRIFTEEFFDSGFASRLLFAMPPRKRKVWSDAVIPPELLETYTQCCRSLYWLNYEETRVPGWKPTKVHLTKEAKTKWEPYYNHWGERQASSEGEKANALSKLEGYTARFALIFALTDFVLGDMRAECVDRHHIERAEILVSWFEREVDRVYAMLRCNDVTLSKTRLLEFIAQEGGQMTARRLFRSNASKYVTSERCKIILEGLVAEGKGHWEVRTPTETGGRPSKVFCLHT